MPVKIKTNGHKRELIPWYEVPEKDLMRDFEWTNEEDLFFEYKGQYYCLREFVPTNNSDFPSWERILNDSFYSGIVFRYTEDEEIIVGWYYVLGEFENE